MATKPISSPVPEAWYPTLSVLMLTMGLLLTASFFMFTLESCFFLGRSIFNVFTGILILGNGPYDDNVDTGSEPEEAKRARTLSLTEAFYEATSSRQNRSLSKELITGIVASVFLGFGSLFLLLASGVYV